MGEPKFNNSDEYYRKMAEAQDREIARDADDRRLADAYRLLERLLGEDADVLIAVIRATIEKKRSAEQFKTPEGNQ